jgi:hypothetical protein
MWIVYFNVALAVVTGVSMVVAPGYWRRSWQAREMRQGRKPRGYSDGFIRVVGVVILGALAGSWVYVESLWRR